MSTKIKHYSVEISDGRGIIGRDNSFNIYEHSVIAENAFRLVIDDLHFTTLEKKKDRYSSCLEKPSIGLYASDNVWGNRITYSLFTTKTKKAASIKKEIEAAVLERFGFFISGLSLDVIQDSKKGGAA